MSIDPSFGRKSAPPRGLYTRLGRNLGYLAGGTGAAAIFNMLALAFNARALSTEEFGLLVLLQAAALGMNGLMSFSTQQPVIHLGAAAMAAGDNKLVARIAALGLAFDVVSAALACGAGFMVVLFGGELIGISPEQKAAAAVFAGSLLFSGYRTSDGLFRLLNQFRLMSLIQAGMAAGILAISALFWLIETSFIAYVWAWAAFLAMTSQVQLWTALHLLRKSGVPPPASFRGMEKAHIRTFLTYCWTSWGTSSTETVRAQGDSLLVGALAGVGAAGIYNVAKQLAGILRKLTAIYISAVFPEVAALAAAKNLDAARRLRSKIVVAGLAVGAAAVAASAIAGEMLLELAFGARFGGGYPALIILTAAFAGQLISHTYVIYVQVFVSPARLFLIYLLSTLIFVLLAPPLTLWLSIEGTALAQLAFTFSLICFGHLALRKSALHAPALAHQRHD